MKGGDEMADLVTFIVSVIANVIGDVIAYCICRLLGRYIDDDI